MELLATREGQASIVSALNDITSAVSAGNTVDKIYNSMMQSYGYPFTASTSADMTDQSKIYVYVGTTDSNFTNGNWYYYDGSAWVSGGVFNSQALQTDTALSVSGKAADAETVGTALYKSKDRSSNIAIGLTYWRPGVDGYSSSNPFTTANIPSNSYTYAKGDVISITNDVVSISESKYYWVFCWTNLYDTTRRRYEIIGIPLSTDKILTHYIGHTATSGSSVYWENASHDTTLSILGAAAESKATGDQLRLRFKIGGSIPANTDLNSVTEIGCYFLNVSTTYVNSPIASTVAGLLEVFEGSTEEATAKVQRVTTYNTDPAITYYRRRLNGNWNAWKLQTVEDAFRFISVPADNTDLDTITTTGYYILPSDNTYVNIPFNSRTSAVLEVFGGSTNTKVQRCTSYVAPNPVTYIRRNLNSDWNEWRVVGCSVAQKNSENAFELYTDFTLEAGWWSSSGTIYATDTQYHTEMLKVRPSTAYYVGHKIDGNLSYGAFFDENGAYISSLLNEDLTQYMYQIADGVPGADRSGYAGVYTFTTPANAAYFSYNYSGAELRAYRNYVCSKPIFMLTGSGNYVLKKSDPLLQRWKNKKLCVIGSSNTMIDRLFRAGADSNFNQCVVGFQEYLYPYFDDVVSYGYSGASWRKYDTSTRSIYSRVVSDRLDLSGYDVFLLMQSGNALTLSTIGSVSSPTDLGNNETYVGAIRQVIDYIYQQNPNAIVYVQLIRYRADVNLGYTCNEELKKMANYISCPVIDLWSDAGMNAYNHQLYSYDGGSHCNQLGNQVMGFAIRKAIIGI